MTLGRWKNLFAIGPVRLHQSADDPVAMKMITTISIGNDVKHILAQPRGLVVTVGAILEWTRMVSLLDISREVTKDSIGTVAEGLIVVESHSFHRVASTLYQKVS